MKHPSRTTFHASRITSLALTLLLLALPRPSHAVVAYSWNGSQVIPDNNPSGVALPFTLTGQALSIANLTVTLDLMGGYNGDLYAYLTHGDEYAVLLNRVGMGSANTDGYSTPGMAVTLSSGAGSDLHWYQSQGPIYNGNGQLTGTWGADGRTANPITTPANLYDLAARSAQLNSFIGANPNGEWTLFMADLSGGGQATLTSFSVDFSPVPEPWETGAVSVAVVLAVFLVRRWRGTVPERGA
ncbi:MAG: PEP-CTERM sorting domain-containing protein [Verrucomicrobiota bacterium]